MRFGLAPLAGLMVLGLAAACGQGDQAGLPTVAIAVTGDKGGSAELTVEVARTAGERAMGLMFRQSLAEDRGMLFVFQQDTQTGFWMKDTTIPLSIAFIRADGTIVDVQDMEPLTTGLHRPPRPYRYALEVNQGWFGEHALGPGDRVEGLDEVGALAGR